jgi:hypothetical protein
MIEDAHLLAYLLFKKITSADVLYLLNNYYT